MGDHVINVGGRSRARYPRSGALLGYLIATQRTDSRYQELADRLKRKQPESESAQSKAAKQQKRS